MTDLIRAYENSSAHGVMHDCTSDFEAQCSTYLNPRLRSRPPSTIFKYRIRMYLNKRQNQTLRFYTNTPVQEWNQAQ
jgi:hypothetical protein